MFFDRRHKNKQILVELKLIGVVLSEATLKRRMNTDWGWFRRQRREPSLDEIERFIRIEINGINSNAGYKRMRNILRIQYDMHFRAKTVQLTMKKIDPDGVVLRKSGGLKRRVMYSVGPDETWSFDGHDKLMPYDLAIHGCVDVFSGKLIWFNVNVTNHDPRLKAFNYLQAVLARGGICILLSDSNDHALRLWDRNSNACFKSFSIS